MSDTAATNEVRKLAALDLQALREEWRRLYGPPPRLRSPDLLRYLLAWRIQSALEGGLDRDTRRRLRQSSPTVPALPTPSAGTTITREWQGVIHEVKVLGTGFSYKGQAYRSLSEIARAITGSRWNGPRFFGLRKSGNQP